MEALRFRDAMGGEMRLLGSITDVDPRRHQVQVKFPHERVDTFKTAFGKEAFRESFQRRLPVMCWQHDMRDPIGRAVKAQVLPSHNELVGVFSDIDRVPNAGRAFSQLDDGTLTDFSFGYTDGPEFPHPDPVLRRQGVRQIPRANMREFSPVTIGSIPGAMATGLREAGLAVVAAEGVGLITDPDTIANLVRATVLTPEQGQALLSDLVPQLRERLGTITLPELVEGTPDAGTRDWAKWNAEHDAGDAGKSVWSEKYNRPMPTSPGPYRKSMAWSPEHQADFEDRYVNTERQLHTGEATPEELSAVAQSHHDAADDAANNGDRSGESLHRALAYGIERAVDEHSRFDRAEPGVESTRDTEPRGGTMDTRADATEAEKAADATEAACAAAKSAMADGDPQGARDHAREARGHHRRATSAADDKNPADAAAIERARLAASEATDVTDDASSERAWKGDGPITAAHVYAALERAEPEMAVRLRDAHLVVSPQEVGILFRHMDGSVMDPSTGDAIDLGGDSETPDEAASLIASTDAALDAARQWLEDVDVSALPSEVQQALALVQAASVAIDAAMDVLGIPDADEGDDGEDDGQRSAAAISSKPWSDFGEGDYDDDQWERACLVDRGGDATAKDRCSLPVLEPDGTPNANGIAAAASRLGSLKDVSEDQRKTAAKKIMSFYGKMKKPVPPNVLKVLSGKATDDGDRADEAAAADQLANERRIAERLLERRLAGR